MDEKRVDESNQSLGHYLRELRENKKISLEEISQRTRILLTVLKALENDDYETLPGRTYMRGFIKSFIKEVGGDLNHALLLLDKQYDLLKQKPPHPAKKSERAKFEQGNYSIDPHSKKRRPIKISFGLPLTLGIVLLIILGVFAYQIIRGLLQAPRIIDSSETITEVIPTAVPTTTPSGSPKSSPQSNVKEAAPVVSTPPSQMSVPLLRPTPTPTPALPLAQEKSPSDEKEKKAEEAKKEEVKKEESVKEKVVTLKRRQHPTYSVKGDAPENNDSTVLPNEIKAQAISGQQNVFVKADEVPTWITYKIGDQSIQKTKIEKGRSLLLQGNEIRLVMYNAKSAKIFYNNQLVQVEGSASEFIFPPENTQKHKSPIFVYPEKGPAITSDEYEKLIKSTEDVDKKTEEAKQ